MILSLSFLLLKILKLIYGRLTVFREYFLAPEYVVEYEYSGGIGPSKY